jgi:hypothetical protein
MPLAINIIFNTLALWNILLSTSGLVAVFADSADIGLLKCGGAEAGEKQLGDWLYTSGLVNIIGTLILAAAFNATHWYPDPGEQGPLRHRVAYRLPFIALGIFYVYRVFLSLYHAMPILSICLSTGRSFGTTVLFLQTVTYLFIPLFFGVYAIVLFI